MQTFFLFVFLLELTVCIAHHVQLHDQPITLIKSMLQFKETQVQYLPLEEVVLLLFF